MSHYKSLIKPHVIRWLCQILLTQNRPIPLLQYVLINSYSLIYHMLESSKRPKRIDSMSDLMTTYNWTSDLAYVLKAPPLLLCGPEQLNYIQKHIPVTVICLCNRLE